MRLYESKSGYAKPNAQENLRGRTHYVDNDTLRYHRARVISARHTSDGLLFWLVESVQVNPPHSWGHSGPNRREFRFVIFDLYGNEIGDRAKLGEGWRTSAQAEKAMWKRLNEIDAKAVNLAALENAKRWQLREWADDEKRIQTAAAQERQAA